MWNLYDDLISAVPDNLGVADCLAGLNWFLVKSVGVGGPCDRRKPLEQFGMPVI